MLAIEGVPGVGKSTAAAILAARYAAPRLALSDAFRRLRREAALDDADPLTQLLYYLAATSHLGASFDGGPVIVDRWVPSVMALIEVHGGLERGKLAALATPILAELARPTAIVLLTATPEIAQERINRRTKPALHTTSAHRRAAADLGFLDAWQRAMRHWCDHIGPSHVIDTTTLPVEEVAAAIADVWSEAPTGAAPDR